MRDYFSACTFIICFTCALHMSDIESGGCVTVYNYCCYFPQFHIFLHRWPQISSPVFPILLPLYFQFIQSISIYYIWINYLIMHVGYRNCMIDCLMIFPLHSMPCELDVPCVHDCRSYVIIDDCSYRDS